MCGSAQVPKGMAEFSVDTPGMPLSPKCVFVSVRQPAADAPLVSAMVVGDISAAGFKVALTAPVERDGYILEWQALSERGSYAPEDGETLALGYSDFFEGVARFLGYDPSALTEDQRAEVDMCVQSGVRNFYWPPVATSREWDFLKLDGMLSVAEGIDSYLLPDGMGHIQGQISFSPAEHMRGIVVVPFGEIEMMRRRPATGAPRFAAVVASNSFGAKGQLKRIHFYPCPDKAYALSFRATADSGRLGEARPFPLGGHEFSELVMESCLAVAEQRINDEHGIHTQNFNTLIAAAIDRDGRSGAQVFGQMGDHNDW